MFYDIEELSLKELFKGIILEEADVILLDYKGKVLKCNFESFPIWCLWQTGECIDSLEFASKLVERKVKRNECFYIFRILNGDLKGDYIIPQKELSEYLKNVYVCRRFKNIEKISFNPLILKLVSLYPHGRSWYHGTKTNQISSIKDIDPNKGLNFGDYGKGVYLTNAFSIARDYSYSLGGRITKKSKIFIGHWCNDSLEQLYANLLNKVQSNSTEEFYFDYLVGKNGENIKVKVFMGYSQFWCQAIWEGWIEGKRQEDCDLVLGPLSKGKTGLLRENILKKINIIGKEKAKELFFSQLDIETFEEKDIVYDAYQLCIYHSKIMTFFN